MRPIVSRGTWAGREPFGRPVPRRVDGPVASLTRARIRPTRAAAFWRSVPPVSADLHRVDGLRLAVGVGEAPVGLQGTFSLWRDGAALQEFAHGRSAHVDVVRRTPEEGWYAEEPVRPAAGALGRRHVRRRDPVTADAVHHPARTVGDVGPARRLARVLAAAAVLAQIAYPLLDGAALRADTIATVLLFAAASVTHCAATRGVRAAVLLLALGGGAGLLAEAVGVATGVPFGAYAYAGTLGPQVAGVPLIVPLAWVMMGYPALVLGRRLGGAHDARVVLLGGLALAAWDLFLDPQMVAAGHWTWQFPVPALPGVPGIPLTNYAGWVLVALVVVGLLHRALPEPPADAPAPHDVPAALLAWTWAGSTFGNAVFFGRPGVALWGGVAMGLLVVPYLRSVHRARARRPRAPA
nr:carotenoid biosynthesis protein [Angustibacter aerolatus]